MKNVSCVKCGYGWVTKSEMFLVSCPKCGVKVDTRKKLTKPQIISELKEENNKEVKE